MRLFPYKCVGVIYAWYDHKYAIGTGFIIGERFVLTVAHNVYSRKKASYFSDLVFYPGVSGEHKQNGGFKVID